MVDKENQVPFGTIGWTDYDREKRCLIEGRVLRALSEYRKTKPYQEVYKLIGDFLYQYVDMMYAHVVIDNIASIKLHERIGFKRNEGVIAYPQELTKLGMKQMEFVRSKHDFMLVRNFWE